MRELFLYGHHGGSNLNVINSRVQIELEFQLTTTIATSFNTPNYLHSDCVKHKEYKVKAIIALQKQRQSYHAWKMKIAIQVTKYVESQKGTHWNTC